jgi:hypothetical protein
MRAIRVVIGPAGQVATVMAIRSHILHFTKFPELFVPIEHNVCRALDGVRELLTTVWTAWRAARLPVELEYAARCNRWACNLLTGELGRSARRSDAATIVSA